jgi:peptidoglycan/xylan/chitin deacetylase (PgdA/CDA1 family)
MADMTSRSALGSPWVSLGLGAVLLALVALTLVPGLVPGPGGSPSPAAAASPSLPATPGASPTFGYPTPSPEPTFAAVRVRVGDSLTTIATAYRTTPRSIAWWNRGTYPSLDPESPGYDPNDLKPGWILVLIPGTIVDEENPPSPSPAPATPQPSPTPEPTATSTPRPTATSGPSPSVSPSPKPTAEPPSLAAIVSHGSRSSGRIALTFDMGGRVVPALDIVNWLIDHEVHATIFPTGETGTTTTGKAVLALVAAHPELFDLGNHSWDHPYFTKLSAAQMATELQTTEAAVAPLAGQSTKPWFRPPYGAVNAAVQAGVAAAGWGYVVMWDVDTIDWKPVKQGGPTADDIVAKVTANAKAGSIVLMHLGGYKTLDALPGILAAVEAKGLQPATLGELLGH